MCAIIDTNVVHEAFGTKTTPAGTKFREWLKGPHGMLVVGGDHLRELTRNSNFEKWFREANRGQGLVSQISQSDIDSSRTALSQNQEVRSDDENVLALALASGARLLFTNDRDLQKDFGNINVIPSPAGQVYRTQIPGDRSQDGSFRDEHESILANARCS